MIINSILLIFCPFVIRLFFLLAKKYDKYLFLYSVLGFLSFILSYIIFSLITTSLFLLAFDNFVSNDIVMSCFTIPFALLISGVYYKFLELKFKKSNKNSDIKEIGRN